MKIVDRATFLELPEDTIFADYANDLFGELGPVSIKGYTYRDASGVAFDFDRQELTQLEWTDGAEFERVVRAAEGGASVALDLDCTARDDCAEQQRYAIWEPQDVAQLIGRLRRCARGCGVDRWADLSGNGNDLSQGNKARQPTRIELSALPTETGYYWVRARDDGRYVPEENRRERVVWYEADPDDPRPVRVHGNDFSFAVSDFEWLEGPIRRTT